MMLPSAPLLSFEGSMRVSNACSQASSSLVLEDLIMASYVSLAAQLIFEAWCVCRLKYMYCKDLIARSSLVNEGGSSSR